MASGSKGLGRGLNALFEDQEPELEVFEEVIGQTDQNQNSPDGGVSVLPVAQLSPGMAQPRIDFDQDALNELAESIKQHGILQPLLVRPATDRITKDIIDGQYEIIAGERRWRAAQIAQLHEVPVVIRTFEDEQAMQIALIENLQREDLNPVEEALGYQRLMQEYEYTQNKVAEALGRSRSHIANMTRMLTLPEPVLELVRTGDLSSGHVRVLIPFDDPMPLAEKILSDGMSVREAEKYAKSFHVDGAAQDNNSNTSVKNATKQLENAMMQDPNLLAAQDEMSQLLGTEFIIDSKNIENGGQIKISFNDLRHLNDILDLLKQGTNNDSKRFLD